MTEIGDLKYLIESFNDNHDLKEIILLGKDEGVRRIILGEEE